MSERYKLNKPNSVHSNGKGYITFEGHTMLQCDIVRDLNRMKELEKQVEDAKDVMSRVGIEDGLSDSEALYELSFIFKKEQEKG